MNKRLIIKIGSDVITSQDSLNYKRINSLAEDISKLHRLEYEIIVVTSGAISSGIKKIGLKNRPKRIVEKRVIASVGQCYLVEAYARAFHSINVAQVLLTWKEFEDKESKLKAKETLNEMLKEKIIPIINENDAIADEEIRFSDNDNLALKVAELIDARRLILLTDVDGLFTEDPKKDKNSQLIHRVSEMTSDIKAVAKKSNNKFGTGGMLSKIIVAEKAMKNEIITNILNGKKEGLIVSLIKDKKKIGTEFSKYK